MCTAGASALHAKSDNFDVPAHAARWGSVRPARRSTASVDCSSNDTALFPMTFGLLATQNTSSKVPFPLSLSPSLALSPSRPHLKRGPEGQRLESVEALNGVAVRQCQPVTKTLTLGPLCLTKSAPRTKTRNKETGTATVPGGPPHHGCL